MDAGQTKLYALMAVVGLLMAALVVTGRRRRGTFALSALVTFIGRPSSAVGRLRQMTPARWRALGVNSALVTVSLAAVYAPLGNAAYMLSHGPHPAPVQGAAGPLPVGPGLAMGFLALVVWVSFAQRSWQARPISRWAVVALCFAAALTAVDISWHVAARIAA
jgi:hypothetical protein